MIQKLLEVYWKLRRGLGLQVYSGAELQMMRRINEYLISKEGTDIGLAKDGSKIQAKIQALGGLHE